MYRMITAAEDLRAYLDHLERRGVDRVALDLEGEFNLHCYGMHLCLVQVYDGEECVLIDPLAMEDPRAVGLLTESPLMEKVVFDPSSDLSLLRNSLQLTITRIVDVRIAAAMLGLTRLSLDAVLETQMGIPAGGKKSSQKANWMRRPLPQKLLDYAATDVLHLLELEAVFRADLKSLGLLSEFEHRCDAYSRKDYRIDRSTQHLKTRGAGDLGPGQRTFLKHFWRARDTAARRMNVPPARIMENRTLVSISRRPPTSLPDWRHLEGTTRSFPRMVEDFDRARIAAEQEIRHTGSRRERSGRNPKRGPRTGS